MHSVLNMSNNHCKPNNCPFYIPAVSLLYVLFSKNNHEQKLVTKEIVKMEISLIINSLLITSIKVTLDDNYQSL